MEVSNSAISYRYPHLYPSSSSSSSSYIPIPPRQTHQKLTSKLKLKLKSITHHQSITLELSYPKPNLTQIPSSAHPDPHLSAQDQKMKQILGKSHCVFIHTVKPIKGEKESNKESDMRNQTPFPTISVGPTNRKICTYLSYISQTIVEDLGKKWFKRYYPAYWTALGICGLWYLVLLLMCIFGEGSGGCSLGVCISYTKLYVSKGIV